MENEFANSAKLRAEDFLALHQEPGVFVIPNPWDAGSAKILEIMGFKALATTSAGFAYTLGKADGDIAVSREKTIDNIHDIVQATCIPVSADLGKGFGDDPADCARTIKEAVIWGVSGGSIEDATGNPDDPIYPFGLAVERIKAAVNAKRDAPYPFILTARAENLIYGRDDLKDTIKRLIAFAEAGADVLFAPGLKTLQEIEMVVKAVAPHPVNVLMGIPGTNFTVKMLEQLGVKRISVGSSLARAACGAFSRAAEEILIHGTFSYADEAKPYKELNDLFSCSKG
ncbi:isocitrate lyase/phosphoenolpyruvate mutase family protein [Pedobacter antarcticus]|uniref:isocitrate lyase/PEP mutase family protein n=1 Tax=Pedobacter antarcticus TaxID=34086 RepID=UPI00293146E6|nr:isocitrate lyase/phosphoenolpyruvate mutase family protein [Pedobacter antarcticus]